MVASKQPTHNAKVIGRYALHGSIASGGMATVHLGRLLGPVGFSRTVAIKRLHEHLAGDPEFVQMFIEEARLASRIKHPNVVSTLDVVFSDGELLLVLDFVLGESLARLAKAAHQAGTPPPVPVLLAIMTSSLYGLHAAHEARSERGEMLGIVHRDVSPQNIMVGLDGVARVLDFGVAKATRKTNHTKQGHLKGKVAYMPPEQVKGAPIDRRADVYAASVVLWEALTGLRLFDGDDDFQLANRILTAEVKPPSAYRPGLPAALDAAVLKGLSRAAGERFFTAEDMATALEGVGPLASPREVGRWVEQVSGAAIRERARQITLIESLNMEPSSLSSGPLASEARQVAVARAPSMVQLAPRAPVAAPRPAQPPVPTLAEPEPRLPSASRPELPPVPVPSSVSDPGGVRSFQVPLPPGVPRPSIAARSSGSVIAQPLAPVPRPLSLVSIPEPTAAPEPPPEHLFEEQADPLDRETARPPAVAAPTPPPEPAPPPVGSGPTVALSQPEPPTTLLPTQAPAPPPISQGPGPAFALPSGQASEPGFPLAAAFSEGGESPAASLPGVVDRHGVSQVSSISVARPLGGPVEAPAPPAPRRRVWAVLVAAVLVPVAAAGVWWRGSSADPGVAGSSTSSPEPTASAPPQASSAAPPVASTPPDPTATAPASATAPVASATATATATATSTATATAGTAAGGNQKKLPGKPGCVPPYTIDPRGIRRLKPECL